MIITLSFMTLLCAAFEPDVFFFFFVAMKYQKSKSKIIRRITRRHFPNYDKPPEHHHPHQEDQAFFEYDKSPVHH